MLAQCTRQALQADGTVVKAPLPRSSIAGFTYLRLGPQVCVCVCVLKASDTSSLRAHTLVSLRLPAPRPAGVCVCVYVCVCVCLTPRTLVA
jgi:hypothetical protein